MSAALRRWYPGAFRVDPVTVVTIPNGIAGPEAVPAERRAALPAELGVPGGVLLAATVALLGAGKGHDDLLDAALLLGDAPVCLVLAGSGPEEARLRARLRAEGLEGRVTLSGFGRTSPNCAPPPIWWCIPARPTPCPPPSSTPRPPACRRVATRVGGIPEIVDEEAGVLVPAANPTALAAAIRALADDAPQQRQVGEAARARFAERFEGTAWARRLRALYDEVLAAAEAPTLSAATARAGGTPPAGRNIAPTR